MTPAHLLLAVLAALPKVKASDYPSANTITVVSEQSVVYEADGQFSNTLHSVRMVLTPAGKESASSMSLPYTKDAEKMEVLTAQVIKADGTVVPVSAAGMKDTEQSGDMNIYDPQGRAVQVTFESVAVGDAVEITYKLTRHLPTRPNYFNDIFQFQSTEPMLEATYRVDGPAGLPLTAEIYHPERGAKVKASQKKVGDRIQYQWTAKNAPQMVPEAFMDWTTEVPMLVVTTDPSWEHFSSWWASVTEPQMDVSAELAKKVAELTKDLTTDEEKIKALYDFVASDIRYRGLGVGPRTGYTPRKASETYASRWGVCRDVSILLTAMLRKEGIEAYPVLTNVGDPVLEKIAYDGFNHAIVAIPKKGGGWTYLDPTAKNSSDLLPGYEREQNVLVSMTKGQPLGMIPPVEASANMGHATARSTVAADGSLTSKVTIESRGMFDLVVRSMAAMMPPEQLKQTVEQVIHASLPDAELISVKTSSPLAMKEPMKIEIELKVPSASAQTGDYKLLRTLVTSGALGLETILPQVLGGLPTRKYTLDAHLTFQWDQDEIITLPPGAKVQAFPNQAKAANGVSQVESVCEPGDPGTIKCHRSFQVKSRFINPKQYGELKKTLSQIGQISRQPVILEGK